MKTKSTRNLLVSGAVVIICLIIVWSSTSSQGSHKRYDVKPQIHLPPYTNSFGYPGYVDENIRNIVSKLDSIECKLTELSIRIERIEIALGIRQPKKTAVISKKKN